MIERVYLSIQEPFVQERLTYLCNRMIKRVSHTFIAYSILSPIAAALLATWMRWYADVSTALCMLVIVVIISGSVGICISEYTTIQTVKNLWLRRTQARTDDDRRKAAEIFCIQPSHVVQRCMDKKMGWLYVLFMLETGIITKFTYNKRYLYIDTDVCLYRVKFKNKVSGNVLRMSEQGLVVLDKRPPNNIGKIFENTGIVFEEVAPCDFTT